ncbi:MAG: DUF3341 domain-containing protein [Pirellulales bacterium]|nr:DUF3341 domain-containing protein [Pirellulales bacterium]
MDQAARETDSKQVAGLLAEFDGPQALKAAASGVREAGYTRFEAYSPFPVHGIDAAMGRRRTLLPWLVLGGGIAGGLGALLLQWWTNAVDYPYLISGKPWFSLPANIPVVFEAIILLSALAAFGGGLALSGLPELFHPLLSCARFRRATTDGFFLGIDASDPQFDESRTAALLRSLGAGETELYDRPRTEQKVPRPLVMAVVVAACLALLPPLWIARVRATRSASPRLHLVSDMDFQPKYLPQQSSPLFGDGRAMRPPVEGTMAVDQRGDDPHLLRGEVEGQPATTFPVAVTSDRMKRGRSRYDIYCATCHGLAGDGDGITSQLAFEREEPKWVRPLSVHSQVVRDQPVGQLFQTISDGIRTMPGYSSQISVEDRWAVVLYVLALQRGRHATLEDVPTELRRHLDTALQGDARTPDTER